MKKSSEPVLESILLILLFLWIIFAWVTHIVVCLKTASWGFLIAGALLFPIAWIHGTGIWLGWF